MRAALAQPGQNLPVADFAVRREAAVPPAAPIGEEGMN